MDDTRQGGRDRLEKLPEHESDADVAGELGAGLMSAGGTASDRGTGTLGGVAQGGTGGGSGDAAEEPTDRAVRGSGGYDAAPGITDFTEGDPATGDGIAGTRSPRHDLDADERDQGGDLADRRLDANEAAVRPVDLGPGNR